MEVDTRSVKLEDEPSTSSSNLSKLGLCEVCTSNTGKYTCPRCEVKTCSLKCNKIHKLEIECDGQRDRTKFIPLNKFTNLDLSSDYRLLEEISRTVETSRKKFGRKWIHLPSSLMKLRNCANRRRITLKFLPNKFERHRKNTTYLEFKSKIIYWHIDWIFVNADNLKLTDTKVPETSTISSILSKYLTQQNDECLQEKLQFYQAANIPGIKVYLKAEQKSGKKFYELDPSSNLTDCLKKKIIIEYPTIHVVLKDHSSCYNIIDSDDEDNTEIESRTKTGNEVVAKILKTADEDESLYSSLKNLLFATEYSDEDLSPDEKQ